MAVRLPVEIPTDRIAAFCRQWRITEFALFGSVLRADFGPESDIDVMVSFAPEANPSVFELAAMSRELETILGRRVDLVDRRVIEKSPNYIRRRNILGSAEVIYAA